MSTPPMSPRVPLSPRRPRPDLTDVPPEYATPYPPPMRRPGLKSRIDHNREKFCKRHETIYVPETAPCTPIMNS